VSPDSDVIGTNYDGTTAGKKRQSIRNNRVSPRNSLYRPVGDTLIAEPLANKSVVTRLLLTGVFLTSLFLTGLFLTGLFLTGLFLIGSWRADLSPVCGPGRDHRAGNRKPLHRLASRVSTRSPISSTPAPMIGLPEFEGVPGGSGLALPQRGQSRFFRRPSGYLRAPIRRLRPDRSGAGHRLRRQPAVLADLKTTALSVRPRGEPGCLCRRSRALPGDAARAGPR